MNPSLYDTVVVGAGAAGLMAAIQTARQGLSTLILDSKPRIGAKILMSGGTRCNVTNVSVTEKDYSSEHIRGVRDILRAYPAPKAVAFFESIGVNLIPEKSGKYFPSTHEAKTVLDALTRELERSGARLITAAKVSDISKSSDGNFKIITAAAAYEARTVLLCTGGLSHPTTGSDGSGYALARAFGHTLVEPIPALTPLLTDDEDFKELSGITLDVTLKLERSKGKPVEFKDSFLFTHFGFSGPAALNISRFWLRESKTRAGAPILANFLPQLNEEPFSAEIERMRRRDPALSVTSWFTRQLPERLALLLLKKSGITTDRVMSHFAKADLRILAQNVFRFPLPVTGVYGFQKAEVTAGGVPLLEVSTATLESKLEPGLFLSGEILDADGRIGGFNFQWAWSSSTVAAGGIKKYLKR